MAKLTDAQRIIRRLQSRYTNKEIAHLLGYKSSSTISALSKGKQKTIAPRPESRAIEILTEKKIRNSPPSSNELQSIRKKIRKQRRKSPLNIESLSREIFGPEHTGGISHLEVDDWWELSSHGQFMDSVPSELHEVVDVKLDERRLNWFYYNEKLNRFMVSDKKLDTSTIGVREISGFLFYYHYEKELKDGTEYERDDVPIYNWYYIMPRSNMDSTAEVETQLDAFSSDSYEHMDVSEDKYSFMGDSSSVYPLAYVSEH